jgi:type I restriction enzyme S subunit
MLGTICQLSGGYGFPDSLQGSIEGELPFIKVSDMSLSGNERDIVNANNYVSMRIADLMGWKPFPAGAVVFAKVGAALKLNRRRILVKPTLIDNNMMAAIPQGGFNLAFLYHFLCAIDFGDFVQDGALPSVNQEQIGSIKIPDMNKGEQRRIAEILDTIDEAIQKTEALISKLKAMKRGLLHDLLTRGLDKNGKLRDPKTHPEQFKGSPLGKIPREWRVVSIEAIGADKPHAIVDGPFGSNLKSIHYRKKGVPVIQSGFVTTGEFIAHEYVYVNNALFQAQRRSAVVPGDIVMAKIGAQCGTCAILPEGHPVGILAGNSLKISTNPNYCRTLFLLRVLHRYYQIGLMDKVITETAQPAISLKNLRAMLMPLPSLMEQDSIVSNLNFHDSRIRTEEQYRDKLKLQKKGLMHDLLTGKIRVEM